MARTSCDSAYHCRDGYPCQSCRSVLECPAPKMCHLSKKDQYVCQINQGIAEAVTGVLGGAQFPSCPFYHPRSSRCRFGHTREAAVCAGNFPDSNGISDDFKRQKRSHQTEPVPRIFPPQIIQVLLVDTTCWLPQTDAALAQGERRASWDTPSGFVA